MENIHSNNHKINECIVKSNFIYQIFDINNKSCRIIPLSICRVFDIAVRINPWYYIKYSQYLRAYIKWWIKFAEGSCRIKSTYLAMGSLTQCLIESPLKQSRTQVAARGVCVRLNKYKLYCPSIKISA